MSNLAERIPAAQVPPVCPRHQVPARKSKKDGGWYCPKGDHGRYCTQRWPAEFRPEKEAEEPAENPEENHPAFRVEFQPEKPPLTLEDFHEQVAKLDLLTNTVGQLVNLVFKLRSDLVPGTTAVEAVTAVEAYKALKAVNAVQQPFLGEAVGEAVNGRRGPNGRNGLNGLSRAREAAAS